MDTTTNPTVKELLASMLVEPVATSFLDSGDHYGRNFEHNKTLNFDAQPTVTFDADYGLTVDVYHYLSGILELDDVSIEANKVLDKIKAHWHHEPFNFDSDGDDGDLIPELQEVFTSLYEEHGYDSPKVSKVCNTYNGECLLSQTLLYRTFTFGDNADFGDAYIALQIHGGCDVRGGYTDVRIFKLTGYLMHCPYVHGSWGDFSVDNRENLYRLDIIDPDTGCPIDDDESDLTERDDVKSEDVDIELDTDSMEDYLYLLFD